MEFSKQQKIIFILVVVLIIAILTAGISFALYNKNNFLNKKIESSNIYDKVLSTPVDPDIYIPPKKLSNPPEIIKAVYITGYSAGTPKYINYLNNLLNNTEINAVVIDIKGSDGYITYNSFLPDVQKYKLTNLAIPNIGALVRFLHNKNIYIIGRIAVFEDPIYSKIKPELAIYDKTKTTDLSNPILWQDNHKLSWLDPSSKDVWDYNISLAKDVFYNGFDEVNFDYVRFPTDGRTDDIGFPVYDGKKEKSKVIKEFFDYTRRQLLNEKISIDLFGLTTVNTDDMGIGQLIENAFENFDYICPMVYPSHYADGFKGFANPANYPYEVVKYSMDSALSREKKYNDFLIDINSAGSTPTDKIKIIQKPLAKFRPWLQDFDMGAIYNADMVKQEIKATKDSLGSDFNGFMLWNPSNIYTEEAILKPN